MKVIDSYFVALSNGTKAWLSAGKPVPDGADLVETRPMIVPDDGMILRNKETGEESSGHWLRDGDSADMWEEIEEPKEEVNG